MPVNIRRLRKWFAFAAIAVTVVVAGFYFYARWRVQQEVARLPDRLGVEIQQSTEGFTLSRSEGGRTLFTVKASQAVQFREGGRAQLKDVNITVYGRRADRFDQISGSDFLYDPNTGEVSARGEVHIDLEADAAGLERPDQTPPRELRNPIHLKTSGLTFNHKTGRAQTKEEVEFRFPQAEGTAQGATYDAQSQVLTLVSDVRVKSGGQEPARLRARQAVVTGADRNIVLDDVQVERAESNFATDRLTVLLRDDQSIARMQAEGGVRARQEGASPAAVQAARAEFRMGERNKLQSIALSGGVDFRAGGEQPLEGRSRTMQLEFSGENRLQRARAQEAVHLMQRQQQGRQMVELNADAVDFVFGGGQAIERASTSGAAEMVLTGTEVPLGTRAAASQGQAVRTVVTAGRFQADFQRGRLRRLHGAPQARVVSGGSPERVATSRELTAELAPAGGITGLNMEGDFRYREGGRRASAEVARFDAARDELVLTGAPRLEDGSITATAERFRLHRGTGDAQAEGEVKTTYTDVRAQPGGAMLAAGEPIHATAARVTLRSGGRHARYSGGARLWQGANIVQAPTLEFDREERTVVAQGAPGQPVTTVFMQAGAGGQPTPVNVSAARLSYDDQQRRARFEGGVVARGADATLTAQQVDIFLQPQGENRAAPAGKGPSQLQRIVAAGDIVIQQPTRRATGERLVYTAQDGRFVLTGGSPSIFDAEHGKIQGDSLTFFSRDDRVLVGSRDTSSTVTQTRVRD